MSEATPWREATGKERLRLRYQQDAEFRAVNKNRKAKWRAKNARRARAMSAASRAKKPDHYRAYSRNYARRKRCAVSPEQVNALITAQAASCAICVTRFAGEPHVDHNHTTGAVRGLLCGLCNRGLGLFKDDADRLIKAAAYVSAAQNGFG